jgi:hypothetical protein
MPAVREPVRESKPEGREPVRESKPEVREEIAPRAKKRDPRADPEVAPEAPADKAADAADVEVEVEAAAPATAAPAAEPARAPTADRLAELEPLFDRAAWKDIADKLGPPEQADALPPALGLIYSLARRESAGEDVAKGATELGIRSMAALLGLPPGSPTALVLAKRLLRQTPASWRTRPAPPARLTAAIILLTIALGVAAGSFLSLEAIHKLF